jgi:hypothetical protein
MIIVNLKGGLGNQMFQYACGRALSLRNKARGNIGTLRLDDTGFDRIKAQAGAITKRSYELGAWNIQARIAEDAEIRCVKYPLGIISKAVRFFRAKALREFNIGFDPSVLALGDKVYLDGFWQTEKYFKDFEAEIRNDFTLAKPPGAAAQKWFHSIGKARNSVSLHVRRGDYVNDASTGAHHGSCGKDYYEKAVMEMAQRINERATAARTAAPATPQARKGKQKAKPAETISIPNIFVFSDDIAWAKANLAFPCPTFFVSSPELQPFEEMVLMSACRHHIIANSTFSWWGAWLGQNDDKMVIAPARWAVEHNDDWYKDIIPESWTRI